MAHNQHRRQTRTQTRVLYDNSENEMNNSNKMASKSTQQATLTPKTMIKEIDSDFNIIFVILGKFWKNIRILVSTLLYLLLLYGINGNIIKINIDRMLHHVC